MRLDGVALTQVSRLVNEASPGMSGRWLAVPSSAPDALGLRRQCRRRYQLDRVVFRQV